MKILPFYLYRYLLIFLLQTFFLFNSFSQKIIHCASAPRKFALDPVYEEGLPPKLSIVISFLDANGNSVLEGGEQGEINITLTNNGQGPAQGLDLFLSNLYPDDTEFPVNCHQKIDFIFPDQSIRIKFPLQSPHLTETREHKIKIDIKEHFGYGPEPSILSFHTQKIFPPLLVFKGLEITEVDTINAISPKDGKIQPEELIEITLYIQNEGKGTAKNPTYFVSSRDPNVYLDNRSGNIDNIKPGEVSSFSFVLNTDNCESLEENLWVYLDVNTENKQGQIKDFHVPLAMNSLPMPVLLKYINTDSLSPLPPSALLSHRSKNIKFHPGKLIDIHQIPSGKYSREHSIAISFGIEKYDVLPPQPYAENDADIISRYFEKLLGIKDVVTYKSNQARGLIFEDVFNPDFGGLERAIRPGETEVFIYFSGHGLPSDNGEDVYLFPASGDPKKLNYQGYNLNNFFQNLDSLNARHITIFFDVSFSGESRYSENIAPKPLVPMDIVRSPPVLSSTWKTNPHLSVFLSGVPSPSQYNMGWDESETGLYTFFLCAGLKGNADLDSDKIITAGELQQYLKTEIKKASINANFFQAPVYYGDPDIVLVKL